MSLSGKVEGVVSVDGNDLLVYGGGVVAVLAEPPRPHHRNLLRAVVKQAAGLSSGYRIRTVKEWRVPDGWRLVRIPNETVRAMVDVGREQVNAKARRTTEFARLVERYGFETALGIMYGRK